MSPKNPKSSCEQNCFKWTASRFGWIQKVVNRKLIFCTIVVCYAEDPILACGTICTNRKGWNSVVMNLLKSPNRENQKPVTIFSMGFCLDSERTTIFYTCPLYHWWATEQLINRMGVKRSYSHVQRSCRCTINSWDM